MKYMGDSNWWNERFKVRELKIIYHKKCLEEDIKYFPRKGNIFYIAIIKGSSIKLECLRIQRPIDCVIKRMIYHEYVKGENR